MHAFFSSIRLLVMCMFFSDKCTVSYLVQKFTKNYNFWEVNTQDRMMMYSIRIEGGHIIPIVLFPYDIWYSECYQHVNSPPFSPEIESIHCIVNIFSVHTIYLPSFLDFELPSSSVYQHVFRFWLHSIVYIFFGMRAFPSPPSAFSYVTFPFPVVVLLEGKSCSCLLSLYFTFFSLHY